MITKEREKVHTLAVQLCYGLSCLREIIGDECFAFHLPFFPFLGGNSRFFRAHKDGKCAMTEETCAGAVLRLLSVTDRRSYPPKGVATSVVSLSNSSGLLLQKFLFFASFDAVSDFRRRELHHALTLGVPLRGIDGTTRYVPITLFGTVLDCVVIVL